MSESHKNPTSPQPRRTAAQPGGPTRSYANPKSNLNLTAGGVGRSGKGEVFAKIAGRNDRNQS
jgi:hypothetical protein